MSKKFGVCYTSGARYLSKNTVYHGIGVKNFLIIGALLTSFTVGKNSSTE
jgi:hypothetical protein